MDLDEKSPGALPLQGCSGLRTAVQVVCVMVVWCLCVLRAVARSVTGSSHPIRYDGMELLVTISYSNYLEWVGPGPPPHRSCLPRSPPLAELRSGDVRAHPVHLQCPALVWNQVQGARAAVRVRGPEPHGEPLDGTHMTRWHRWGCSGATAHGRCVALLPGRQQPWDQDRGHTGRSAAAAPPRAHRPARPTPLRAATR